MKIIKLDNLKNTIEQHAIWLKELGDGCRAELRSEDLHGVNLDSTDLRYADLRNADMSGASMNGADLRYADLRNTDLRGACMNGVELRYADLRGARGVSCA